ncbi:hypothetical protein H2199_004841 [Coniosporium tulheliwenetii]|uniref:Uncharacterized protein n=1 Tax=Coniosporium tulheliwenetii TaxID=3383036 RepID=A0ACC2Z4J0_9PEZI|nr:hypothetical protein H2199_004841 [Cladosporium sp. JES 115]
MANPRSPSPPRKRNKTGFEDPDATQLLEEEMLPGYTPDDYYPVSIGELFESRYRVLGKLGFRMVSTAWLCRDLKEDRHVTLRVYTIEGSSESQKELKVLEHLRTMEPNHAGWYLVRRMLDTLELPGTKGPHRCIVDDPVGFTLSQFRWMCRGKIPGKKLKCVIEHLLAALDFLRSEAKVVHTKFVFIHRVDIHEHNIMLSLLDDSLLKAFEEKESAEPSVYELAGDRVIYASRPLATPKKIWELFEGKPLVRPPSPNTDVSSAVHLAKLIALLGPPPKELLKRGEASEQFFNENGEFTAGIVIPATTLEDEEGVLEGRGGCVPALHTEDAAVEARGQEIA